MDIDRKPVIATYAIGDTYIHGQVADAGLTLCGQWASDVKPLAAGRGLTCSDCSTARTLREHFAEFEADAHAALDRADSLRALGSALRERGIRVTNGN